MAGVPQNVLDSEVDLPTTLSIAADGNVSPLTAAEAFWVQGPVDLSRWNKLFPYQLLVVRALANPDGKVSYQAEPGWQFTFPIPPEGLTKGTPYSINNSPTQGGIAEDHNGAVYRMFSLVGTMGVLPGRGRATQQSQTGTERFTAIAGGTIATAGRLAEDGSRTISSALGRSPINENLHRFREFEMTSEATGPAAFVAKTTGYYQLRRLEYFMEAYVAEKKLRRGRDLRLALAEWKKESVWLVTPVELQTSKSGEGGLAEQYSLTLKAFRRIHLESGGFRPVLPAPVRRDPNALAQGLAVLVNARRVLQGISKVADAAVGDAIRLVYEPLRQVAMLTKDALGAEQSIAELPDSLARASATAYFQLTGDEIANGKTAQLTDGTAKLQRSSAEAAQAEVQDLTKSASGSDPAATATGSRARQLQGHPAAKPFQDPRANFELLSGIRVSDLKLPPAIRKRIDDEAARVRTLRRRDFELMRDQLRASADRLASALGAGDPTYADTYGLGSVHQIKDEPTDSDWEALYALNDSCIYIDGLAATADGEPSQQLETMEVMAALARRSGIAFKVPRSKFAVPFPYGATLEGLAFTYLGDRDRWHEIAALNGLREPYIDEVGFNLPLSVNGAEHQVVVSDASNLYVGQSCFVWSDQVARTRRRIQGLRAVGGTTVVTLSGDPDMVLYRTEDGARLSAFLPDTLNSQQLVYIPSDRDPIDDDAVTKDIPGVNEFDPMVAACGVDFLLDSTNDLVITPDGDNRWAAGLANVVQYVRVMLSIRRGTLPRHPEAGLPLEVGMSTADLDVNSVLGSVRRMFADDPSISKISQVQVSKDGPRASIAASIVVAGTDAPIPLRFDVDPDFFRGAPTPSP